jgi:glycosyltransferase involved in cell wall biosynthesis
MPRVTVIIPTFNYAEVLPFSMGSVLRQTFREFELLVIGDHCTDSSEAVVTSVGDPRVRWINLEKSAGHQSGPNNRGLKEARGELIAYLGHDDLWLPNHLELLVRTIDSGADLTYGITEMVEAEGRAPTFAPEELEYVPGIWVPPSSVVHRKQMVIEAGGWRHYCEVRGTEPESELWGRLHARGARIRLTRRLTAVKFPAALRKDVYAKRPTREQKAWSERIQYEGDFAAVELGRMLRGVPKEGTSFRDSARRFFGDAVVRVRRRLGLLAGKGRRVQKSRGEEYADILKYKGVDVTRSKSN